MEGALAAVPEEGTAASIMSNPDPAVAVPPNPIPSTSADNYNNNYNSNNNNNDDNNGNNNNAEYFVPESNASDVGAFSEYSFQVN